MKTNSLPKFIKESTQINIIGPCPVVRANIDLQLPTLIIDGGLNHKLDLDQSFSIGDGDSSREPLDLILPTEKDESDLAHALSLLEYREIEIFLHGFLGKRRDHEIINIGEVYRFCKESNSRANFDNEIVIIPKGKSALTIEGLFTVATLQESIVTIKGSVKYPLISKTKLRPLSSHGLSNLGDGEVSIESDSPLIIYIQV